MLALIFISVSVSATGLDVWFLYVSRDFQGGRHVHVFIRRHITADQGQKGCEEGELNI